MMDLVIYAVAVRMMIFLVCIFAAGAASYAVVSWAIARLMGW